MEKRKLKSFVMPSVYGLICATLVLSLLVLNKTKSISTMNGSDNYTYVNSSIVKKAVPTISSKDDSTLISKPYSSEKVVIYKKFYDQESTEEERQNSILYYNDTYVQNTGVLYKSEEKFDILSILNGTVLDVKKDDVLGNIIEIKHDNNIISTYEGLSEVSVKKNQTINQGDIIGKSGTMKIDETMDNSLLFEIIYNGKIVNPEKYIDKKINEL